LVLARSTAEINMLDVLEAVDVPVCLNACLLRPGECPRDVLCPAHLSWGRLQSLVIDELKKATLDTLVLRAIAPPDQQQQGASFSYVLERLS
jgi:Rrf2 family iron-sulfur cluster assembly transcriptional regulator